MDEHPQELPLDPVALHRSWQALHAGTIGGDGGPMAPAMQLALDANFGSVQRWREAFTAMAKAYGSGPGWLLLTFLPHDGSLVHQQLADHAHAPAGGVPILALQMAGPADPLDDGTAAGADVDAFMGNIDWAGVYGRYQQAVHAASEPYGASLDEISDALVFDVRRAGVFDQARSVIPGARWRDPAMVSIWSAKLPADRTVVVYCVYGHEVSRATALRLRAAGLSARYLRGGMAGWEAAGRPLADKAAV